jgi:hypothetical protein
VLSNYTFVKYCNFILMQLVESGMNYIYTSQTILIGRRYGLNDVNNIVKDYHGKVCLHWLKQHTAMDIPILHKGKSI